MNKERISFQVAFCRRNRALFELLNDDQIEEIIKDAWNDYAYTSSVKSPNIQDWFEFKYEDWVISFLYGRDVSAEVQQALLKSSKL